MQYLLFFQELWHQITQRTRVNTILHFFFMLFYIFCGFMPFYIFSLCHFTFFVVLCHFTFFLYAILHFLWFYAILHFFFMPFYIFSLIQCSLSEILSRNDYSESYPCWVPPSLYIRRGTCYNENIFIISYKVLDKYII